MMKTSNGGKGVAPVGGRPGQSEESIRRPWPICTDQGATAPTRSGGGAQHRRGLGSGSHQSAQFPTPNLPPYAVHCQCPGPCARPHEAFPRTPRPCPSRLCCATTFFHQCQCLPPRLPSRPAGSFHHFAALSNKSNSSASASVWHTVANAHAVMVITLTFHVGFGVLKLPTHHCTAFASTSNSSAFLWPTLANAHAVLAMFCIVRLHTRYDAALANASNSAASV